MAVFHTAERRDPKTGLPEWDWGSAPHTAAIDSARSKDADPSVVESSCGALVASAAKTLGRRRQLLHLFASGGTARIGELVHAVDPAPCFRC